MHRTGSRWLILILSAAFGIRLAAAWWWDQQCDGRFFFGDSESYWVLARCIAEGEPYRYGRFGSVFRTPGYPLLLAPVMMCGESDVSPLLARLVSVCFGTLTVAGVAWLSARLFDERTALVAAGLCTLYPGSIFTSTLILAEAPFTACLVWCVGVLASGVTSKSRASAVGFGAAAGVLAGAAALIRPSFLLFPVFAALLGMLLTKDRRRILLPGATAVAVMLLVMVPWWIRNYRVCGRFVPTTLQVGPSLYDAFNPEADGSSRMDFTESMVRNVVAAMPEADDIEIELAIDREMKQAAVAWIREHPWDAVKLAGQKFLRTWNPVPNLAALRRPLPAAAIALSYVFVMTTGIGGIVRTMRRGFAYHVVWYPAVYFALLHCVFVGSIRYRQPVMPLMIVFSAAVTVSLWNRFRKHTGHPETSKTERTPLS
ncbi:glycosyltransferase family 39 protein [Thermostilla marina]